MSDPQPIRLIAHFTVDDPERYHAYEQGFFPVLRRYGGRFVTYDDAPVVLEGEHVSGRTVMIEFDSEDDLRGWWESSEYRALAEHRHAGTTTHAVYYLHGPPVHG